MLRSRISGVCSRISEGVFDCLQVKRMTVVNPGGEREAWGGIVECGGKYSGGWMVLRSASAGNSIT